MNGKKFDQSKLRYDLVPPEVLKQMAAVLTFGAKKYGDNNWQKVENGFDRYYAAMMRHVEAAREGEAYDEESGLPHLAHALTCVAFMLYLTQQPKSGPESTESTEPTDLLDALDGLGELALYYYAPKK